MKQSKIMSLLESVINIAIGFGVSLVAQMYFLPLLGVAISFHQNLKFALIMTVISIARQFGMRRLFEALHIRRPLSPFMHAVVAECYRQVEQEGWTAEHDDKEHGDGELARAGAAYAIGERNLVCERWESGEIVNISGRLIWPWSADWWKPTDFRRNLVKACALVIAEGNRFDRKRRRRSRRGWNAAI